MSYYVQTELYDFEKKVRQFFRTTLIPAMTYAAETCASGLPVPLATTMNLLSESTFQQLVICCLIGCTKGDT
ncbi:hypothetical protein Y032_0126g1306 [Ancylostoma ceylanicum]|uniref:Uncharacterized protein n=1 Tax=Ancylostoma ceylanicum TaxID=53326 RepID=A0A016T7H2_9BILA|nr:hypothetical protein Y032_0126g1306 [Ancylostoma ceylanicum]